MDANSRIEGLVAGLASLAGNGISRATSPGAGWRDTDGSNSEERREDRPRTFPYSKHLPYHVETEDKRQRDLAVILEYLYISVEAGDIARGAVHWTRELRSWLGLKLDLQKETRVKLVKFYYALALAPGVDQSSGDKFAGMFMVLTKRKHYMVPVKDIVLDWRPMLRELKIFVLPHELGILPNADMKRNVRTLTKLCTFAQLYYDPRDIPLMLEEILPYFTASFTEGAFVVTVLLNLMLPTNPAPPGELDVYPQHYLPTLFHLWSIIARSKTMDNHYVDVFSRLARDALPAGHIPFSEHGIFTKEQSSLIFTAILRLLEIPVGQATSPYNGGVDLLAGMAVLVDRDPRKHPVAHQIARWIVMSLSPACLDKPDSILAHLEGLIQAVETFFHPSNSGSWTKTLCQLVYFLADFFVMRWNREKSGELIVPEGRRLNDEVKTRFVRCLREVIFMGIYSKSQTAMGYSLSTLQSLAYLEPSLILPGALQRIYPSMQGLVEVHRTTSSLRSLQVLTRILVRTKGFRCHVTTLLGLALPGIDANDLEKTLHTLSFIQTACYNIPFHDLTEGHDDISGSSLAMQWITSEVDRLEREGAGVELDYQSDLPDADEVMVLRSSTTGFGEFVISLLGKVFTLLENLPDASRVRSGSPEENVVNTLPATFTPLFASLSPELYDIALNKIADFVANHVIHQARDAMAFLCNALCKVNPSKALKRLVPMLVQAVRTEIDENGAGSTRNTGLDVLPRDRGLVWSISMLSMCVVHVGEAVLDYKEDLFSVALYMQEKCKGNSTVHVSNFIHHLLLNLTGTYTVDFSLYDPEVIQNGLRPEHWGMALNPSELKIRWHVPSHPEIEFAVRLFQSQAENALKRLTSLIGDASPVKRDGTGKEWSDEVSRNLVLIRLILAGVSILFDSAAVSEQAKKAKDTNGSVKVPGHGEEINSEETATDSFAGESEDEEKPTFHYPTGYPLNLNDPLYSTVHDLRENIGEVLHEVHCFLTAKQEDDVSCFNALYTAYRSWFVDVGFERSAHVLDRVTRLLASDIGPYKVSGLRKDYPRPLLLRRAHLYHLQRLRHNASPRARSHLDETLLLDLAESSVSLYTAIRRTAQNASESAMKAIVGARPLVIPPLLKALEVAIKANDHPRIKGALYTLLLGSLSKTLGRNWKFTPSFIRSFIAVSTVDKPSIQKLTTGATFQVMEFGRPLERMLILDEGVTNLIAPSESVEERISKKRAFVKRKRETTEAAKANMVPELVELAKGSHWKTAGRTASILGSLGLRFETLANDELVKLFTTGAIDAHPGLRGFYAGALVMLCTLVEMRGFCEHKYENYLLDKQTVPGKTEIPTRRDNPNWTAEFLSSFAKPETEYYVDSDHCGWLVWDATIPAIKADGKESVQYDDVELHVRKQVGALLNRHWFATFFDYLKQEPRDSSADRFRMTSAMLLVFAFDLMAHGETTATLQEVKEQLDLVYGDGSDKHQHRATAEVLGALLLSVQDEPVEKQTEVWDYAFPLIRKIFSDGLTPENLTYWTTFLHVIFQGKDPRRSWPLIQWLADFKLDMSSNAAFKESSKIQLLHQCTSDIGWHFQLEKPVLQNLLEHIDHPYKGVREIMGQTLASIYRIKYHESYKDVETLIDEQKKASSIGSRPYKPSAEYSATIQETFDRLEKWRHERTPGQQTPSSYTAGSKTVLIWLDTTLTSHESTELVQFFPDVFLEQLLHMMDVKEDPELQSLAYHVFRHLPNIPHRAGEDHQFIKALVRIGKTSSLWHQRLRVLINIQVIYFRQLFLISETDQQALFDCVSEMLEDAQLEVRLGASATLSGMIRCSPVALRTNIVELLNQKFKEMIPASLPPKRSAAGTPTPEHTKMVLTRHAAVLGLGALIQAFPYMSPPPAWLPGSLAFLAVKAASDPGMVGKSVKSILSDFKKTRQDTWHVDVKVFTPEQLEDLEGVLWKSYFA